MADNTWDLKSSPSLSKFHLVGGRGQACSCRGLTKQYNKNENSEKLLTCRFNTQVKFLVLKVIVQTGFIPPDQHLQPMLWKGHTCRNWGHREGFHISRLSNYRALAQLINFLLVKMLLKISVPLTLELSHTPFCIR